MWVSVGQSGPRIVAFRSPGRSPEADRGGQFVRLASVVTRASWPTAPRYSPGAPQPGVMPATAAGATVDVPELPSRVSARGHDATVLGKPRPGHPRVGTPRPCVAAPRVVGSAGMKTIEQLVQSIDTYLETLREEITSLTRALRSSSPGPSLRHAPPPRRLGVRPRDALAGGTCRARPTWRQPATFTGCYPPATA